MRFKSDVSQEIIELVDFGVIDLLKCIGEPMIGVNIVLQTASHQGVNQGVSLSRLMVTGKQVVLSA